MIVFVFDECFMTFYKIKYLKPDADSFLLEEYQVRILCESPKPGGNEGLTYEEW